MVRMYIASIQIQLGESDSSIKQTKEYNLIQNFKQLININISHFNFIFSKSGLIISSKEAGFIGRDGALEKQPFMVAFFRISDVHIRATRSTGGKRRQQNRNRSMQQQDGSRSSGPAGWSDVCNTESQLHNLLQHIFTLTSC